MLCLFPLQFKYSTPGIHIPFILSPTAVHQAWFPVPKLRIISKELLCSYPTDRMKCFPGISLSRKVVRCVASKLLLLLLLRERIEQGSSVSHWHDISQHSNISGTRNRLFSVKIHLAQDSINSVDIETWVSCSYQKSSRWLILFYVTVLPSWSSGQSSWLQIRRPGFDSRH
jgi:hypothetical protein